MILEKYLYRRSNYFLNLFKLAKKSVSLFWNLTVKKNRNTDGDFTTMGAPALTVKEDGSLRCTSCLLCQEICPSHCIDIQVDKKNGEETAPISFDLSILRCTFCGLCEDVCPVDAIRMAGPRFIAGHSEDNWVWSKDHLSTYAGELKSKVGEDRPLLPY